MQTQYTTNYIISPLALIILSFRFLFFPLKGKKEKKHKEKYATLLDFTLILESTISSWEKPFFTGSPYFKE